MMRKLAGLVALAVWLVPAAGWAQNLIEGGDTATLAPFVARFNGNQAISETGAKHWQWSANCWDSGAQGEIFLADAPVVGKRAIGLRNLSGRASIQLYNWKPLPLSAGTRYVLSFAYLTEGSAEGAMIVKGRTLKEFSHSLAGTGGTWKKVRMAITPKQDGDLSLMVQNYGVGSGNALYVADLNLSVDAGANRVAQR